MNRGHGPQSYVRMLRKQSGLTQRDLAHLLGYESASSVSYLEDGRKLPAVPELLTLELVFGVMAGALLPGLRHRVALALKTRIEDIQKFDEAYRATKASVRTSIKTVHLDRILASLRRQLDPGMNVHEPWQNARPDTP
jgi:transcriptional regulator with XRE-family HTH domain